MKANKTEQKLIYHFMDIMPPLGTPTSSSFPGQVTQWCIAINTLRWCGPGCQPVLKLACNVVPSQLADVPASCKVNSDAQCVQLYSKPRSRSRGGVNYKNRRIQGRRQVG